MADLSTHDWSVDPMFDGAVVSHGFTSYMRDYDVTVEVPAANPDGSGSYIASRLRYRFTHCVEAHIETTVGPDVWRTSWSDEFIDHGSWTATGEPDGYVWGVEWSEAYPGPSRVADSPRARSWTNKLDQAMHEIRIQTNAFLIDLVCHGLIVTELAVGDPRTRELKPVD
jgi:hypothetical protein